MTTSDGILGDGMVMDMQSFRWMSVCRVKTS